jgi:antitoxin CptB
MILKNKEITLKRLKVRSWRRGTKEMDLILGNFADDNLASLSSFELKTYDRFLNENDNDLYDWCSRKIEAPEVYRPLITKIMSN